MKEAPSRHAWFILAGGFLAFTISASLMHAYSVFLLAFIAEFRWSRGESSIAYSVGQVVGGVSSPLVGGMVDRLGARRMVLLGGCLLALGLLGSAFATSLWQIVLLYGVVMTLGANCISMVVFAPLISRLFVARRGMAMSMLQSANGFGRAISVPIAQLMVSDMGWRHAYLLQAGVMAVLVLPLAALFRGAEQTPVAKANRDSAPERDWSVAEAIRTRHFWLLSIVYGLTSIGSFLVSLHQLAFAVDRGFDPLYAAFVVGLGSLLALPGVILTGTITAKTADLFGGPRLGTILGLITIGSGLGAGLGAWGAGFLFDLTGSYQLAFMLSIAAYTTGAIVFWALRKPVQG